MIAMQAPELEFDPRPWQVRLYERCIDSLNRGKHPCLVAQPGAGKSYTMRWIAQTALDQGLRVAVITHRVALIEQMARTFKEDGFEFGMKSSQHRKQANDSRLQLCSVQTLAAALKRGEAPPKSDIVMWDEAHLHKEGMALQLMNGVRRDGRVIFNGWKRLRSMMIGVTATPVGLSRIYDELIQEGTPRELREHKAHTYFRCFHAERPRLDDIDRTESGYSQVKMAKRMAVKAIVGNVIRHYNRLNPDRHPTLLFASGQAEARGFAREFKQAGIPAGFIGADGIDILTSEGDYENRQNTPESRAYLFEALRTGEIKVLCNRFVLREAIDFPWVYHLILATSFGSYSTFCQVTGRGQRYWKEYPYAIIQDHGGNIDEWGSPNVQRNWKLSDDNLKIADEMIDSKIRGENTEPEPICCPRCGEYRQRGDTCVNPECRHRHQKAVRYVRQTDGTLREYIGPIHKPLSERQLKQVSPDDIFRTTLFRVANMRNRVGTVGQAVKLAGDQINKAMGRKVNLWKELSVKIPHPKHPDWKKRVDVVYKELGVRRMRDD